MGSTFSEQNAEKLKQAQDRAKNDLDKKKAALAEAEAAKEQCLLEAAKLNAEKNKLVNEANDKIEELINANEDLKNEYQEAKNDIEYFDSEIKQLNKQQEELEKKQSETAKKAMDALKSGDKEKFNELKQETKDMDELIDQKTDTIHEAAAAKDEAQSRINAVKEQIEHSIMNAGMRDEGTDKELDAIKEKLLELDSKKQECDKLQGPIDEAKAAMPKYTAEDIEKMKDLPMRKKPQYYSLAHIQFGNSNDLKDLRNLPNSVNFRKYTMEPGVKNALNASEAIASANNETPLNPSLMTSPSKTFYMNQDYLFSDTLAKVNLNKESLKSAPEIQPLLLNEFQPYYKLELSEIYGGLLNAAGTLLNTVDGWLSFGSFGAKFRMGAQNNFIERISKDPSLLYDMKGTDVFDSTDATKGIRKRKFISSDPVQMVQNMFQRRHMAKHIRTSILWELVSQLTEQRKMVVWKCN